jgi:hypothetical protein
MAIPPFNEFGNLPRGDYPACREEFVLRYAINFHRKGIMTGIHAALSKLGLAGCQRVVMGGSYVTHKEFPNNFNGYYEDFDLNHDLLDPLFVEKVDDQLSVFGGILLAINNYGDIFKTDLDGRPNGIVILDPKEFI